MIVVKSPLEMIKMRDAGQVAGEVLCLLGERVSAGMSTKDLEDIAFEHMKKLNVVSAFKGYMGYPGGICVSVNNEIVHGIPGKKSIRQGDLVSIDVGIEKNGYYGDTAATFIVGKALPEDEALVRTTEEALWSGIAQALPGNHLGDISAAVQQFAEDRGFSVVRDYVGHGIGSAMHEDPAVPNFGEPGKGPLLKKGMTLAIEPMINQGTYKVRVLEDEWTVVTTDGKKSAHFEHTIGITDAEPEVFTCLKKSQ